MSSLAAASAFSSLVVVVPPEGRPNTMSIAISSSRMPPAMRSAGSEMPNSRSTASPNSANTSRMAVAISVPLSAIWRRSAGVLSGVSAANSAATSAGPMVAK